MQESPVTFKSVTFTFFASILVVSVVILSQISDQRTRIVFCDVGQGDGAYIRIQNKIDLLIDAGPDRKILDCLGKYMPFWDKTIDLALITHPDLDHYGGFFYIVSRYKIGKLVTIDHKSQSKSYKQLEKKISANNIPIELKSLGDQIRILDSKLIFFWPPDGLKSFEDNEYSSVFLFEENGFKVIFTGDASPAALGKLINQNSQKDLFYLKNVNILKVPHHGSKHGLTSAFLKLADPEVAVISAGKDNPYGHPNHAILDLLEAANIKIKRTDKDGNVVFKF